MKNIRKIKAQYRDYETKCQSCGWTGDKADLEELTDERMSGRTYTGCPECGSDDLFDTDKYETDEFIGVGTPERRNTNTDYEDYYNHGR